MGHPLFAAEPRPWRAPEGAFDALLIGSAAVFAHGGATLATFRHLPVHAVGTATAEAAQAAGFVVERVGEGGLQALLDAKTDRPINYLRFGGEERVTLAPHPGQTVTEIDVYRMRALPMEPDFASELSASGAVVALHSAAAATHFAQECARLAVPSSALTLLALGPRIAAAAGGGWARVEVSATPADAALLAMAVALCK